MCCMTISIVSPPSQGNRLENISKQVTANEKLEALKKAARQEAIERGDIPQIGPEVKQKG